MTGASASWRFRILTIVDNVSRVSPAIVVGFSLKGVPVVAVLEQLKGTMGLRQRIAVDNGPEFISKALDAWTYRNRVMLASPRIMPTSSRSMGTSRRNDWISTGSRPWLRGGSSTTPSDPIGRWGSGPQRPSWRAGNGWQQQRTNLRVNQSGAQVKSQHRQELHDVSCRIPTPSRFSL